MPFQRRCWLWLPFATDPCQISLRVQHSTALIYQGEWRRPAGVTNRKESHRPGARTPALRIAITRPADSISGCHPRHRYAVQRAHYPCVFINAIRTLRSSPTIRSTSHLRDTKTQRDGFHEQEASSARLGFSGNAIGLPLGRVPAKSERSACASNRDNHGRLGTGSTEAKPSFSH